VYKQDTVILMKAAQPSRRVAAFVALCGGLLAQGPGNQRRAVLQALDKDGNGTLSAQEIAAAPASLLSLDRDGDGRLTEDELQRQRQNGRAANELLMQLLIFDNNQDGTLTPDELPARMQGMFQRGDTNHDGRLTPDEIRSMAENQPLPVGLVHPNPAVTRLDPLLNALDTDHDGIISAAEIASAARSLLRLDANGDGQVAPDEMRVRQQTPQERVDDFLAEWDTNKDGKLSKPESPELMEIEFESIDKNGDGFLDQQELMQYFAAGGVAESGTSGLQPVSPPASTQPDRPREQKQ
jgi:Ca2+-binding EF-hand superfamily protein